MSPAPPDPDLDDLAAAFELIALPYNDQRALLPPDGYGDDGVMRECVEGLRDAMARMPDLLRRGGIGALAAADALACHLRMESLVRDAERATPRAFAAHADWQQVRALAATVAAAVRAGPT